MKSKKDLVFRKIIKYADTPTAPADFTSAVMQEINAQQEEALVNPALGTLIRQHGIEEAPVDFRRMVMVHLQEAEQQKIYNPVISIKTGVFIAAITVIIILISSIQVKTTANPGTSHNYQQFISLISSIPPVYLLTLFCLCTLMLADYFLRRTHRTASLKTTNQ